MKSFDTRVFNISEFVEWSSRGQLELSPKFQRRGVWSPKAKSYLIDTILRGKPIPKLLLTQELRDRRNIRIVIDGQQRLRAILEFVEGTFAVSKAHNKAYAGRRFDGLPDEVAKEFLKYEIGVDLIYDLPYKDLLDIFARLNTYTVKLNPQELLNAQYVGYFKQLSYDLGYAYVEYLVASGVMTDAQVTRMAEATLTSDLLIALVDEVQTNKTIESFYQKYDDEFDNIDQIESRFHAIMTTIGAIYTPEELRETNWSRIQLFYTLFTAIAHLQFGVGGLDPVDRIVISEPVITRLRFALDTISASFDEYTALLPATDRIPADYAGFIQAARRGTTDTAARQTRSNFVAKKTAQLLAE